jgi:lipopolysaccharide export system protein LptC
MDDETTRLVEPVLKVFEAGAPPWRVQSERGWVSGDSKLVLLEGSVRITRRGDVHSRPIRILTSNLRVHPSEDYVEGDESVSLETPGHRVEAVGVRAWLREPSRIEFLSQVRGIHEAR